MITRQKGKNLFITAILIAINCIVYCLQNFVFDEYEFSVIFGLNPLFFSGAYYQLISSMFLHGSFTHLAMNMIVLYQFGCILERFLGVAKFGFIYLLGGILTNALSLIYIFIKLNLGENINTIGASGAICVLLGVLAFFDKFSRKGLFIALIIMSFAPVLMGINVAWYAHLCGFGVGFLMSKILYKRTNL